MLVISSRRPHRGFSLIELMVVVTIVAIVAAIAAPSFVNIFATMRVKTMAGEIQSALTYARSEAMKRNLNVTVTPATVGWQGGWVVTANLSTPLQLQKRDAFAAGAKNITSTSIHSFVFRPNGLCTTPDVFITLTSTDTTLTRCVKISLSGLPISRETCS